MLISEVIRAKNESLARATGAVGAVGAVGVITIGPGDTVRTLIRLLDEHAVGALVVSADGMTIAGIVSERDVVRQLHRQGAGVLDQSISSIMTVDVHTCAPEDNLETIATVMTSRRVRHLPVVSDGKLIAIISIGDVVKNRIDELQVERDQLVDYIHR